MLHVRRAVRHRSGVNMKIEKALAIVKNVVDDDLASIEWNFDEHQGKKFKNELLEAWDKIVEVCNDNK